MFLFSASRSSLMVMLALQAALVCTTVAAAARSQTSWPSALAAGGSFLLLPITNEQMSMVMTELLLTLFCLLAVLAWARYLSSPSLWRSACFSLLASAAIFVKGDAVSLALVPPLSLLLMWNLRLVRQWHFWVAPGLTCLLCGPYYFWTRSLAALGWVGGEKPSFAYTISTLPEMGSALARTLGAPLLVLTGLGLVACLTLRCQRQNVLVSSVSSLLLGGLALEAVIPAGMEDRKLYFLLPACLILATIGTHSLLAWSRPALSLRAAGALTSLLLLGAAASHFQLVSRYDRGFRDVANLLKQEIDDKVAVVLVSSNYNGEGLLIASVAEAHPRPAPYVIRANEVLADAGWAQPTYHLRTETTDKVAQELSALQPGFLVLHDVADFRAIPHHDLIKALVKKSPGSYSCIFTRTVQTNMGMERLEVYRAFPITGATPNLESVYSHLQKSLSKFLILKKEGTRRPN